MSITTTAGGDGGHDDIPHKGAADAANGEDVDAATTTATMEDSAAPPPNSSTAAGRAAVLRVGLSEWTQHFGSRVKSQSVEWGHRAHDARTRLWSKATQLRVSSSSGSAKKEDDDGPIVADSLEDALRVLKRLIQQAKDRENPPPPSTEEEKPPSESPKGPSKWDFPYTPLEDFQATVDDLLTAFCKWSTQDVDDGAVEKSGDPASTADEGERNHASGNGIVLDNRMDISKAFARLESYVNWMYANKSYFEDDPLTATSVAFAARRLGFLISHDVEGRLVWWMDLGKMDWDSLRMGRVPGRAILRYIAWLSHACLLDSSAQDNGMLIVEDANRLGLWTLLRAMPPQIQRQNHQLTWGVLPLKTKCVYVLRPGSGLHALMVASKPFVSAKMRRRIVVLRDEADIRSHVVEGVGGVEYVPEHCCGLHGTSTKELVFGKYIPAGAGLVDDAATTITATEPAPAAGKGDEDDDL